MSEILDSRGRTEAEAIAQFRAANYPKPSLTADMVALARDADGEISVLMIRRGGHPYLGCLALPGGFAEPGETIQTSAARELEEETHLTDQELYDSLCMTPESIIEWMKSLYEHREAVTLLVRCAAGTLFENFHHDWAERMNVLDYKYYMEARKRGIAEKELTPEEMHVLTSALWTL